MAHSHINYFPLLSVLTCCTAVYKCERLLWFDVIDSLLRC